MGQSKEYIFHFSVAKWLHLNNYKFFYELSLPNTGYRPDFLAVSPEGQKLIIECKLPVKWQHMSVLKKMRKYLELINDPSVKGWIALPEGTPDTESFAKKCEQIKTNVVFIPFETPMPYEFMNFSLHGNIVTEYFPSYALPMYAPVVNKWGRLLLD